MGFAKLIVFVSISITALDNACLILGAPQSQYSPNYYVNPSQAFGTPQNQYSQNYLNRGQQVGVPQQPPSQNYFNPGQQFGIPQQPPSQNYFNPGQMFGVPQVPPPQQGLKKCADGTLYLNATRKCYKTSTRGPCPATMAVMPLGNYRSPIGHCACEGDVSCASRPKVFWKPTSRCYFLFDQGPCPKGQWLNVMSNDESVCETIPCPAEYEAQGDPLDNPNKIASNEFIFPYNNKCYKTFAPADFCPQDETVRFYYNILKPQCFGPGGCGASGSGGENTCSDGSAPDSNGGCEPVFDL